MVWVLFKTLVFTVVLPCTVAAYVPWWLLASDPSAGLNPRLPLCAVASALMALGVAIYLWCVWDFAAVGRGTPAPIDPPKTLVARGLYRVVRNPMYFGVLTVLFGEALLFGSQTLTVYAMCVWLGFHLFVLAYEEPTLRSLFGESYEQYCRHVRRWLPTLPRDARTP
jgi:protein-S-isoprenylcysteine O-methyltransferase Ste14